MQIKYFYKNRNSFLKISKKISLLLVIFFNLKCTTINSNESTEPIFYKSSSIKSDGSHSIAKIIADRMDLIRSYYASTPDPYTGTIRVSDKCRESNEFYAIQNTEIGIYQIASIYLNKNNSFGACETTPDSKKVVYVVFHCASNQDTVTQGYLDNFNYSRSSILKFLCKK